MRRHFFWLVTSSVLVACAGGPAVQSAKELPIKTVVLYRSGVGYFEREGRFEGSALTFSVKQREVGDFLSSLTAVEQNAGGVRSVSFDVPEPTPAPRCKEDEPCPEPPNPEEQLVAVRLMLANEERHDLNVSYVVGSPIWRPSYRVVFDKGDDKALLQAWAVVQNTSGEDWRNVRLSLTTGAPISFRSDLGTPITPERPLVSDTGEVVTSVPGAETTLQQEAEPAMAPPPPAAAAPMEEADQAEAAKKDRSSERMRRGYAAKPAPMPAPGGGAGASAARLEQAVAVQAKAQALAGTVTRYDLSHPVTIPDGGSTMVAIVSARVAGEKAHLFAPDPGVALSMQHPFSVARMRNDSGAVLEKGPVAVLSEGAFLGQGVLDTLPREASAFVPFALDKSLVVETGEHYDEQQGALLRIQRGIVTVQRFSERKTRYRVRNGGDEPAKVYVRHARWGEAELVAPPEGTELAPQRALVPLSVPPKTQRELEVVERSPVQTDFSFMDQPAADAIGVWLTGPARDAVLSQALKDALALRAELLKLQDQTAGLEREQAELQSSADETRQNLKAIEKVKTAADLRSRLLARLKQLDLRLAELTRELVEARTKQSELQVRLNEALENVSLSAK